jgi:hypothetical protein
MSRLLYGTDWVFLVLFGNTHVNYVSRVHRLISNLATGGLNMAPATAIFHTNAARFLGLVDGEKTAERLRAFYEQSPPLKEALDRVILPRLVASG